MLFEFQNIGKSFGPIEVLSDISLKLEAGQVHAICGENGAGKSTLMKILAGVYPASSGQMTIDGKAYLPKNPLDALKAGIAMIYQELDLAEDLTVAENVFLGCELTCAGMPLTLDDKSMQNRVHELLQQYGFELNPESLIGNLSVAEAQIVELLKALHKNARIIVMDEPTSSLSDSEAERLFDIIADLTQRGLCIVYISHRMGEIQRLADVVSVLRDGRMIATAPISQMPTERIIELMVGRELTEYYPPRNVSLGDVVVSVQNLDDGHKVHDVSFEIRSGEIVGMAGLVGAGRTETADAIFGVSRKNSGHVILDGKILKIESPADAISAGIAYLTEDRKRNGLCVGLSCHWNITLPNFDHIGMRHLLDLTRERTLSEAAGAAVHVKWNSYDEPAENLSGGNQQKLLLARWLVAESKFLIFDEPTRGIDVAAKAEVYALLNDLAAHGKAILLISSELQEILGVCDRVLVMRDGQITANLSRLMATQENIMIAATK